MTRAELKAHLARHGFTQPAAARILGVSVDAVELWLAGKRRVNPSAARLVRVLDVPGVRDALEQISP